MRLAETPVEEDKYESLLSKYEDVFEGFRCLPGKHRITVDQAVKAAIHPCRKIPFTIRNQYKEELEQMEREPVIVKVMEPTDWVNSAVIVHKKNGRLRVCLNPRDLNRAIKRQHFKLPTREETMSRFTGAQILSKVDASQGFYQIQLDEEIANSVPSTHLLAASGIFAYHLGIPLHQKCTQVPSEQYLKAYQTWIPQWMIQ